MRMAFKAGLGCLCAGVLVAGVAVTPAAAQLSDDATRAYMNYAWAMTPVKFTTQSGNTIEIDKKKRNEVEVPMDLAKEIIAVAGRSARAQVCELFQEQANNYNSLGKRLDQKQLTAQQRVFASMLHLAVVQLNSGKATIKEQDESGKVVEMKDMPSKAIKACSDEERVKLRDNIATYVKQGPPLATADNVAPTQTGSTTPAKK